MKEELKEASIHNIMPKTLLKISCGPGGILFSFLERRGKHNGAVGGGNAPFTGCHPPLIKKNMMMVIMMNICAEIAHLTD